MNYKTNRTEQQDLPNEEWKWVQGFEGVYEVSNKGRIKTHKQGKTYWTLGGKTTQNYLKAMFCINGKVVKQRLIHDLVAQTFIRKFDSKKEIVHHISGNKAENNVQNLRIENRAEHTYNHKKGWKQSSQTIQKRIASRKHNAITQKKGF